MSNDTPDLRARRAAVNTLPAEDQPAALAALADTVETEEGLPGVAKSLRLLAREQARAHLPDDHPLHARLDARLAGGRVSPRPCPLDRPVPPDRANWRARMRDLAETRKRRRGDTP